MTRRRCQLCSRAVPTDQPAVFVAGRPHHASTRPVSEPPLHRHCAAYALRVCPHLVAGHRSGLAHAEATQYVLLEEHVSPGPDNTLVTHTRLPGEPPRPTDPPSALQHYLAVPDAPWTPADHWPATHH
ncbi:hypothetical protein ACFC26_31040 [Kitasatospora purpeofusca]|uniref:hypothetical protein n=1 Tax=Kitasatospora purpeofusca TaxID=67352 RepID=UPI0035DA1AFB